MLFFYPYLCGMGVSITKAKKTIYKGIKFQSRLEAHLYKLFDDAGVKVYYERDSFNVVDSFYFPNKSYEKTLNSKNTLINKGEKKHLGIRYTPDFTIDIGDEKIVIECKGIATDVFQMRFKLFKKYVAENNLNFTIYTPRNQKQNEWVFEQVIKKLKGLN